MECKKEKVKGNKNMTSLNKIDATEKKIRRRIKKVAKHFSKKTVDKINAKNRDKAKVKKNK